jgi:predicted GTPase
MNRKIFISYNFYDQEISHSVKNMFPSHCENILGKAMFVDNNQTNPNHGTIGKAIEQAISGCDIALFVIGHNNYNSPWLEREAQFADSLNIPIVLVLLPGTHGYVPNSLAGENHPIAQWDAYDIGYTLAQY